MLLNQFSLQKQAWMGIWAIFDQKKWSQFQFSMSQPNNIIQ